MMDGFSLSLVSLVLAVGFPSLGGFSLSLVCL